MRRTIGLTVLLAGGFLLAGCGESPKGTAGSKNTGAAATAKDALPAELFLAQAPQNAREVGELKADSGVTQGRVVVHGRIGGRAEPFVMGKAAFLLVDMAIATCSEKSSDDGCPTPWDYCCEPKDRLTAHTATIQIADADGRPLRVNIEGQRGLKPMAEIVVVGEVAQHDEGVLVINATGIYVKTAAG